MPQENINESLVQFIVRLPFSIKQKGSWYISSCEPLDVFSQGKTEKEAITNLKEAVQIFFTTCFEMGTLDKVLKECGFTLSPNQGQTVVKSNRRRSMNIPLNFLTLKDNVQTCPV